MTWRDMAGRRAGAGLPWSLDAGEGRRGLTDLSYSDRTIRLVTVAPVVVLAAGVGAQLPLTLVYNAQRRSTLISMVLLACYLPVLGYQLWSAAHLRRPRAAGWSYALIAIVIAVGLVLVRNEWQLTLGHLIVSTLIVLPRRWSVLVAGLILAAVVPVDLLVNPAPDPLWTMLVVVQRAGVLLVPAWFAGALRELRATRELLADQAVLRERVRMDGELARTVGNALDTIAVRGAAATALAGADPDGADPDGARRELRELVDGSRRTLAEARRLIRGYQRVPLRTELDTAMALLSAAGVPARLVLADELPRYADLDVREALRAAVDRLLHEEHAGPFAIVVDASAGRLRLTVAPDGVPR